MIIFEFHQSKFNGSHGSMGQSLPAVRLHSCGAASLITKSEQRCVRNEVGLGVCVVFFDGNPIIEKKRFPESVALRSANVDGAPLQHLDA